jgi:hypothetical protein
VVLLSEGTLLYRLKNRLPCTAVSYRHHLLLFVTTTNFADIHNDRRALAFCVYSSVSIVTGYGLDDLDSIPGSEKNSLLQSVQTSFGVNAAFYTRGAGHSFPGVKRPRREIDHSPLSSDEVRNGGAISPLPHTSSWRGACLITHRDNSTFTCRDISLWLYSPNGSWPLFHFLNLYAVSRTPWTGDQPVARPLPTHTEEHKHRLNEQRHPCLEWDSKPRSQCSSERRRFMP